MKAIEPRMIEVPAGEFEMGVPSCPPNANLYWRWDTSGPIKVAAFQMGRCAVTNAEYGEYVRGTGAAAAISMAKPGFDAPDQPAGGVSWEEATAYCQWLARTTGRAYRLPRDAEWEYAARGGRAHTIFSWGNALDPALACFGGQAAPSPVASFPPNGFGLHDMVGNIWEWCEERYEDVSQGIKATNKPTGKDPASNRVLRGGSYLTTNVLNMWIAYRHEDPMDLRHECIGFRVAL